MFKRNAKYLIFLLLLSLLLFQGGSAQQTGGPVNLTTSSPYSCTITYAALGTAQCQAIPSVGLRNYIQNYQIFTTAAGTATTIQIEYGTGSACGTGTTVLTPAYPNTTASAVNTPGVLVNFGGAGLVPPTANAICVVEAGTTTGAGQVTITGFIAP